MRIRPCGQQPPNENALVDDDLSSFHLKEADEGLELPRLVAYSRLGVIWMNGGSRWSRGSSRGSTPRIDNEMLRKAAAYFAMSRKACCLDNAVMENSYKSLKSWRVDLVRYRSSERARTDIVNGIEGFHHCRRLHTAIGYRTSMQFERQLMAA